MNYVNCDWILNMLLICVHIFTFGFFCPFAVSEKICMIWGFTNHACNKIWFKWWKKRINIFFYSSCSRQQKKTEKTLVCTRLIVFLGDWYVGPKESNKHSEGTLWVVQQYLQNELLLILGEFLIMQFCQQYVFYRRLLQACLLIPVSSFHCIINVNPDKS